MRVERLLKSCTSFILGFIRGPERHGVTSPGRTWSKGRESEKENREIDGSEERKGSLLDRSGEFPETHRQERLTLRRGDP